MKVSELLQLINNGGCVITNKLSQKKLNIEITVTEHEKSLIVNAVSEINELKGNPTFNARAITLDRANYLSLESNDSLGNYTWFKHPGIGSDIQKQRSKYSLLIATSGYINDGRNCSLCTH